MQFYLGTWLHRRGVYPSHMEGQWSHATKQVLSVHLLHGNIRGRKAIASYKAPDSVLPSRGTSLNLKVNKFQMTRECAVLSISFHSTVQ